MVNVDIAQLEDQFSVNDGKGWKICIDPQRIHLVMVCLKIIWPFWAILGRGACQGVQSYDARWAVRSCGIPCCYHVTCLSHPVSSWKSYFDQLSVYILHACRFLEPKNVSQPSCQQFVKSLLLDKGRMESRGPHVHKRDPRGLDLLMCLGARRCRKTCFVCYFLHSHSGRFCWTFDKVCVWGTSLCYSRKRVLCGRMTPSPKQCGIQVDVASTRLRKQMESIHTKDVCFYN